MTEALPSRDEFASRTNEAPGILNAIRDNLADPTLPESQSIESVSPSLHLGAVGATRSAWLGPAWAALCGLIASATFSFDAPDLLVAAFVFILADWAWPALWTTCVRTDWLAPIGHWPNTPAPARSIQVPYLQPGSPGDRWLTWAARAGAWWRSFFAPMAGASATSALAALAIGLALSAAIGWRALALTLAVVALTGVGALRALRTGLDSDWLRSIVYGALPWWLGHAAFAPLTAESAGISVLFGLAYRALMNTTQADRAPSPAGLIAPQIVAAAALFSGYEPVAAFVVVLALAAQAALRALLTDHSFARRAQFWLMLAMLACAIAVT